VAASSRRRCPSRKLPDHGAHERAVRAEFERTASTFAERTRGRFDHMDVVAFARVEDVDVVVEVGAGTGNFLSLFRSAARSLVAVDLTEAMLREARPRHPGMHLVVANGAALPLRSRSADLVASAQVLHHVPRPVRLLVEMRRVAGAEGRVLIVDQVAPERYEEARALHELEVLRDPSHAGTRPPSAFRTMLGVAGLRVVDERIAEDTQQLSRWMWAEEFPEERIEAVRDFIERRGSATGMGFERDGDDWAFVRRRIMLLAERA
jgi:ubiquinone/menaquinone biosynthesis C-methylase UbiE